MKLCPQNETRGTEQSMSTEKVDNDRNDDIEMIVIISGTQPRDEEQCHDVSHDASHDPRTTGAEQHIESDQVTIRALTTDESFMTTQQEVCQPTDDLKPHHSRTNDAESSSGAYADHTGSLIDSEPLIVTQPVDDDRVSLLSINIQATQADDSADADELKSLF